MNIIYKSSLKIGFVFACLTAPLDILAHEAKHDATDVEVVKSSFAVPSLIHVQKTKEGIEVKGWVKRKNIIGKT